MPRLEASHWQHTDMIDRTESRLIQQERRNRLRSATKPQPHPPGRKRRVDRAVGEA
jgi:hypothetical protein